MPIIAAFLKEVSELLPSRSDALELVSFITGADYDRLPLMMSENIEITFEINNILNELKQGKPLAYITGRRFFCGHEFFVNENVLIPRHETEILVEKAVENSPCAAPRILDLCTGSGCVLLSVLAELEGAAGVGVDISGGALEVAEKNADRHKLSGRAEFVRGDVLSGMPVTGGFDMVLCNPPYVTYEEYLNLEKSVFFEPRQALVAADEGLAFYKKLIDIVPELCNKNWIALAEIGQGQNTALSKIFSGFEHRFYYDLSGIERVLFWKSLL
jgi:release factor glutamine methyltransferase